jgi:hypothetical protein
MAADSKVHFYLNWAKERIDEMDAVLVSLEARLAQVAADSRAKANQFIANARKTRDEFKAIVQKQAQAGEVAWESTKRQLEADWARFEADVKKYLEAAGQDVEQQKAIFQSQVAAQIKAWRETADKIHAAGMQLAAEGQREMDAAVTRMRSDAAAAEEKLQKLGRAGTQSWNAFAAGLAETRGVFDRANQAAREAFKRAASSAA